MFGGVRRSNSGWRNVSERRGEARVFARRSTLKGKSWFGEEKLIQKEREVKEESE